MDTPEDPVEEKRFKMETVRTFSAAVTPWMTLAILVLTIYNVFFR